VPAAAATTTMASDVAATCSTLSRTTYISSGIATRPPPTPSSADSRPTSMPVSATTGSVSRIGRAAQRAPAHQLHRREQQEHAEPTFNSSCGTRAASSAPAEAETTENAAIGTPPSTRRARHARTSPSPRWPSAR
jgi:hypothetical protein